MSSDHQKPTGQPVVVETAGFEMTIATLFGFFLLTGFRSLWLMVKSFRSGSVLRICGYRVSFPICFGKCPGCGSARPVATRMPATGSALAIPCCAAGGTRRSAAVWMQLRCTLPHEGVGNSAPTSD